MPPTQPATIASSRTGPWATRPRPLRSGARRIWPANFWPPSSLVTAPLDYGIWGFVESKACATPHPSMDALKASVQKEWADMSEAYICKVCQAFRPRLQAMVDADGGHFEK